MLKRLFGEPELTGLESDAYWLGSFLGVLGASGPTFVLAVLLVPADVAMELSPVLIVVALVLSRPLASGFQRLLSRDVREVRAWRRPARDRDRPTTEAPTSGLNTG